MNNITSLALAALLLAAWLLSSAGNLASAAEISYTLPADVRVSLAIYDAAGRQMRTPLNAEPQKADRQPVAWDGLDRERKPLPTGQQARKLVQPSGTGSM